MWKTPIGQLRMIGMLEGLSFLVLLVVAMPLKYLWGYPLAVRIVGTIHGMLFIGVCVVLMNVKQVLGWELRRAGAILLAALVPFGPFVIDGRLRREDAVLQAARRRAAA
jgi:integral membrane protein